MKARTILAGRATCKKGKSKKIKIKIKRMNRVINESREKKGRETVGGPHGGRQADRDGHDALWGDREGREDMCLREVGSSHATPQPDGVSCQSKAFWERGRRGSRQVSTHKVRRERNTKKKEKDSEREREIMQYTNILKIHVSYYVLFQFKINNVRK